jgi:carbon-monoxide dehydrogenase medium subunit
VHKLLQAKDVWLMMGGTDLLPQMRDGVVRPKIVVDLKGLPGIHQVTLDAGGLTIGAAATMNQVARDPDVLAHFPALAQAANSVASFQIRNRATIGGNLCNASPCADTSPAVLAYEGEMIVSGAGRSHFLPVDEFFVVPGKTALDSNEFLEAIRFPYPPSGGAGVYHKLGRNKRGDLAVVGVAVTGWPDPSTRSGFRFRIALGSVAPTPLRVPAAEEILADEPFGEVSVTAAADKAMAAASPISDVRAGASYQTKMVRTLVIRAIREVSAALGVE